MTRILIAVMLLHLSLTGQTVWFWTFGGAWAIWELLLLGDWLYQRRVQRRRKKCLNKY